MSIKVQPQAPMPAARRRAQPSKYPFDSMEVGAWFFVPDEGYEDGVKAASVRAAMYRQNAVREARGQRFAARSVYAVFSARKGWTQVDASHADAVPGTGVWREM